MRKTVGYISYDTEDVIGKCPVCPGDLVESPELSAELNLTENERLDFELGFWSIAVCAACGFVQLRLPAEVE